MKTMFIGVIIVGIIILAVLLALNLMSGSGIMGYDCAKEWDRLASASIKLHSNDLDGASILLSQIEKGAEEFQANNCHSTVSEWGAGSQYSFAIPDEWK